MAEQIIMYSTFIKFIRVTLSSYDIVVAEDSVVIRTQAKLKLQVLRNTIETVFPHIIGDECLVAQLVGQEVEPDIGITFSFNAEGKCCKYEFDVDYVGAFASIVKDPRKLETLLGKALIADNCMLGLLDEPVEAPGRSYGVMLEDERTRLVDELNELQNLTDTAESPTLLPRSNPRGHAALQRVVDDYYYVFAKGYHLRGERKLERVSGHTQDEFIAQVFVPERAGSPQVGGRYVQRRWRALSECFDVLEFQQKSTLPVEYKDRECACVIRSTASYALRITPYTIESVFPHVLSDRLLVAALVGNVLVVTSKLVFTFETDTGRIARIVERMGFVEPMAANREDLSFVLSQALLCLDGVSCSSPPPVRTQLPPLAALQESSENRATNTRTLTMADILHPGSSNANECFGVTLILRPSHAWHGTSLQHEPTQRYPGVASPSRSSMSEPKGPPSMGDAKKPSKKSSSRPSVAASVSQPAVQAPVATSAPLVGAVPKVPRIPLAEPKPDAASSESKRKPSKKRTSSTSRAGDGSGPTSRESTPPGPSGPSGPDALSTADAVAAAKHKEDVEREKQARREAKKQRAKEIEEAKRREDLAKQALEEAQRLEEQRQREARQKQQVEALNANAEECQEEADDYDDDGFENYDEDFEQEEVSQPKSTPLPGVGAKASAKNRGGRSSDIADEAELKRIQQAMQAESKGLLSASSQPSSSSEVVPSSRGKERPADARPTTSIASSIAGLKQSLDPRAKRAKEIVERRKFEVEKFSLFQQKPVSEQDKVLSRLRRGLVQQAFVQTTDGSRSLGTQTKSPETHDKSMHFPDDIGIDKDSSAGTDNNEDGGAASSSSTRFFKFLEHAAYVCETLAVENVMACEREAQGNQEEITKKTGEDEGEESEDKSMGRRYQLSKTSRLDQKLVFPSKKVDSLLSLEQILQGRDLVALRFSPSVSSTLLTCYGAAHGVGEGGNQSQEPSKLFKDKTISCIWDVNLLNRPLHLLKSEGVASAACLSPSRDLFVVVGTEDGSIHVWDLRPQSMIQSASPPVDGLAVCTPAYSTCGMNYRAPEQHSSTVVALEPIDRSKGSGDTGGTFQFGSMDDRGVLIIWSLIEFDSADEALATDKCVQIGGNVKMVMNTRIDMQQQYLTPFVRPKQPTRRGSKTSVLPLSPTPVASRALAQVGPVVAVLKFFPHDPNQFVVGTRTGQLVRGHRFEKASSRMMYQREQSLKTTDASAGVVCIDFHPLESDYFLVGYEDGSICLYHAEVSLCLTSWEEVSFGVNVCAVAWSPSRPAVFYGSFSNDTVLVWDLLESTSGPTLSHELDALKDVSPVELASSLYPLVLSAEKMRTSRPAVAWRIDPAVSPFQFAIHELSPEFTVRAPLEQQTVAKVLTYIL